MKREVADNDELLDIVSGIIEDKTIEFSKKVYSDKIKKLEEASLNYIGENDLKLLKTEFTENWKCLTKKLAYPYEYFNSLEDYQKPVDNLKKEEFFRKLKNDSPTER